MSANRSSAPTEALADICECEAEDRNGEENVCVLTDVRVQDRV